MFHTKLVNYRPLIPIHQKHISMFLIHSKIMGSKISRAHSTTSQKFPFRFFRVTIYNLPIFRQKKAMWNYVGFLSRLQCLKIAINPCISFSMIVAAGCVNAVSTITIDRKLTSINCLDLNSCRIQGASFVFIMGPNLGRNIQIWFICRFSFITVHLLSSTLMVSLNVCWLRIIISIDTGFNRTIIFFNAILMLWSNFSALYGYSNCKKSIITTVKLGL